MPAVTILSTGINPKLRKLVEEAAKRSAVDVEYVEPRPDAGIFDIIDEVHERERMASIVILDGHGRAKNEIHLMKEERGKDPATGSELVKEVPTEQVMDRICRRTRQDGRPQWHGMLIVQTCEGAVMHRLFSRMNVPVLCYGKKRALEAAVCDSGTRELIERIGQYGQCRSAFHPYPETVFKWVSRVSGDKVELVRGSRESLVSGAATPEDLGDDVSEEKLAQAFGVCIAMGTCEEAGRFLDIWPNLLKQDLLGECDAIFLACEREDEQAMLHFLISRGALREVPLDCFAYYARNAGLPQLCIHNALLDELDQRVRAQVQEQATCTSSQKAKIFLRNARDMLLELIYSRAPDAQLACLAIWRGVRGFEPESCPGIYEALFLWMAQICADATGMDADHLETLLGVGCADIDKPEWEDFVSQDALEHVVESAFVSGSDPLDWLVSGPVADLADMTSRHNSEYWEACRKEADAILHRYCLPLQAV